MQHASMHGGQRYAMCGNGFTNKLLFFIVLIIAEKHYLSLQNIWRGGSQLDKFVKR
jgi:hypothetical protein